VSCSDSRVPPTVIFDAIDIGELFEIRVAGQALSSTDYESIEYAIKHVHPQPAVVVVVGHTHCGAVKATYAAVTDPKTNGYLKKEFPKIIQSIRPSVVSVVESPKFAGLSEEKKLTACSTHNAALVASQIYSRFKQQISVMPLMYDVETGRATRGKMLEATASCASEPAFDQ
jgi:carbonic anhydrase